VAIETRRGLRGMFVSKDIERRGEVLMSVPMLLAIWCADDCSLCCPAPLLPSSVFSLNSAACVQPQLTLPPAPSAQTFSTPRDPSTHSMAPHTNPQVPGLLQHRRAGRPSAAHPRRAHPPQRPLAPRAADAGARGRRSEPRGVPSGVPPPAGFARPGALVCG